ncbi:MAG: amidohydrolase [Actinomycetota bacterium]|nr:MAG: amidohydrolase [Actinomycetota bacterium]
MPTDHAPVAVEPVAVAPVEPQLPVIDAHHHLFPDDAGPLRWGRYGLTELAADFDAGHQVVGSVFLECGAAYRTDGPPLLRPVGESEWLASLHTPPEMICGVVAFADVRAGAGIVPVLDGHAAALGDRFKGIRFVVGHDDSPELISTRWPLPPRTLVSPEVLAAVAAVAERQLTFETWVYFHQLDQVAELAAAVPQATIVLDHLGGPAAAGPYASRRTEVLAQWRDGLAAVAAYDNVVLKVSGLGFDPYLPPGAASPRTDVQLADYWAEPVHYALEVFGTRRCIAGSNFPVDGLQIDYVTTWNALKLLTATLPADGRDEVLCGTARSVYGLVTSGTGAGQAVP